MKTNKENIVTKVVRAGHVIYYIDLKLDNRGRRVVQITESADQHGVIVRHKVMMKASALGNFIAALKSIANENEQTEVAREK